MNVPAIIIADEKNLVLRIDSASTDFLILLPETLDFLQGAQGAIGKRLCCDTTAKYGHQPGAGQVAVILESQPEGAFLIPLNLGKNGHRSLLMRLHELKQIGAEFFAVAGMYCA